MPRNNQRGSNNNNPEGRNQFNSGWMDSARERPFAAAATAAAAVGAGVFLWSRRNQISEQLTNLSDQIGEWSENMNSGNSNREFESAGASSDFSGSAGSSASPSSSPNPSSGSGRRGGRGGTSGSTPTGGSSGSFSGQSGGAGSGGTGA